MYYLKVDNPIKVGKLSVLTHYLSVVTQLQVAAGSMNPTHAWRHATVSGIIA
jgi:hypothetical protein